MHRACLGSKPRSFVAMLSGRQRFTPEREGGMGYRGARGSGKGKGLPAVAAASRVTAIFRYNMWMGMGRMKVSAVRRSGLFDRVTPDGLGTNFV